MPDTASQTNGSKPYGMTWGAPVKYVRIPAGERGTVATLKVMKQLVLGPWGHRNPEVVNLARLIVEGTSRGPAKNYRAMAEKILAFMKTNVDYVLDPAGLEYVPTAWHTLLVSGKEDCDGHAVSIASLAMALGMKAGFRTVKGDPGRPEQWSHVYAVIGVPGKKGKVEWLTADSTQPESYLGWDPPEGKLFGMKTWVIDPSIEEGPRWDY
jgi:transglutaminase-like putative cysteine protease